MFAKLLRHLLGMPEPALPAPKYLPSFADIPAAEDGFVAKANETDLRNLDRTVLLFEARVFTRREVARGTRPTDDAIVQYLLAHASALPQLSLRPTAMPE